MQKQQMPKWLEGYQEVLMNDESQDLNEAQEVTEFSKLLSENSSKKFVEGEVFSGKVVKLTDDYVTIDIGYKQEGIVPTKEFKSYNGSVSIEVGQDIEVYLEKLESANGNLILSKDKAEILKAWDKISESCEKGLSVEGTVIGKVKGGLSVDIGVKAFLPGSQIDVRPVRNLDKFLGKKLDFKVIKFNKKRGNIVLSRKVILQEERGKLRDETLKQIKEGMIVKGVVKNITDYGAFIDLGGVDGLLHITDMSWGRVKHPSNILTIGEEIEVKILKFETEKGRVSLGLKQVQENPWASASEKYSLGTKVKGNVVSIKDYGIFVELDDGIEGLVHISEVSWSQKPKHPSKVTSVGDVIESVVLDVDTENKRISLGLRQLTDNPWEQIATDFTVGQHVVGTVKSIVDFGLFVDVSKEIDALIHVSDVSWVNKNVNLSEEFKAGDEVKAMVLTVNKEDQKFCLGIKQLEEDPWKKIEERFPVGVVVEKSVVRVTDYGAFVELETGIEGLIHVSELSEERIEKPSDAIKKEDVVNAMIISVDKESKKISLSLKAVGKAEERENMRSYAVEAEQKTTLAGKLKGINISS
jgi:small subunit ribosomal protein S1